MIVYDESINVKEYNDLRITVGWQNIEPKQCERGLKNSAYITVARKHGQVIGMARVVTDGGYVALIVDVVVRPDHQNLGIGKQLMTNVMDYLDGTVKEGQLLMVNLMSAYEREGFYEKFGFIGRPNEKMGPGMIQYIDKRS